MRHCQAYHLRTSSHYPGRTGKTDAAVPPVHRATHGQSRRCCEELRTHRGPPADSGVGGQVKNQLLAAGMLLLGVAAIGKVALSWVDYSKESRREKEKQELQHQQEQALGVAPPILVPEDLAFSAYGDGVPSPSPRPLSFLPGYCI